MRAVAKAKKPARGKARKPGEVKVKPAMDEQAIRNMGIAVDLPYEAPPANPERLTYDDAMDPSKGWTPPEGFTIAGVPFEEAAANVGRGALPDPNAPNPDQ